MSIILFDIYNNHIKLSLADTILPTLWTSKLNMKEIKSPF